jgi:hypothetical protein
MNPEDLQKSSGAHLYRGFHLCVKHQTVRANESVRSALFQAIAERLYALPPDIFIRLNRKPLEFNTVELRRIFC